MSHVALIDADRLADVVVGCAEDADAAIARLQLARKAWPEIVKTEKRRG